MGNRAILGIAAMLIGIGCRADETKRAVAEATMSSNAVSAKASASKEVGKLKEHRSSDWSPGLTDGEKQTLFDIAKDTLEWVVVNGTKGTFAFEKYAITPKLKEKCATFVTFRNRRNLRGCMGCLEAVEPMYQSVQRGASNAARDSRFLFNPIRAAEIPAIEIHVSLLSPRRAIRSLDEFKIGEHGIWMEKGRHGAVYLPEVAAEQKWNKEETLTSLSMKAGLPGDAWRQGATFMVFSSVVLAKE
ncbi:MAG: AmmeMemoRadiSam system protein A [Verrucomicrobiota bacterium]|nr:AmmeMemoRadiSam system protein A [Verrucomicrobiota bacterium]